MMDFLYEVHPSLRDHRTSLSLLCNISVEEGEAMGIPAKSTRTYREHPNEFQVLFCFFLLSPLFLHLSTTSRSHSLSLEMGSRSFKDSEL